jgi:hypothetical protein
LVRHAMDLIAHVLDVDRRANQGRDELSRDWPVVLSVPLTPPEYDALRFLSSLYPANPREIVRACVLLYLDPGSPAPAIREDGLDRERTSRVELGLEDAESTRLEEIAGSAGVDAVKMVRWAVWETLGPLMETPRP